MGRSRQIAAMRGPAGNPRRTHPAMREESKAKILRAAIELIGERGLEEGFSLTDVGNRSGRNRVLAMHYFANRDGLVLAAVEQLFDASPPPPVAEEGLSAVVAEIANAFDRARA